MNRPDQTDPLFTIDHVLLKSKLEQGNRGSGFEGIYPLDTLHHIDSDSLFNLIQTAIDEGAIVPKGRLQILIYPASAEATDEIVTVIGWGSVKGGSYTVAPYTEMSELISRELWHSDAAVTRSIAVVEAIVDLANQVGEETRAVRAITDRKHSN